jgi:hypothetical protein
MDHNKDKKLVSRKAESEADRQKRIKSVQGKLTEDLGDPLKIAAAWRKLDAAAC